MYLTDALEMTSKPVVDDNGNMLVVSRSARTGTQVYTGASVGRPDMQWAVGYRPADEVFAQDSLDSYTAIPVTIEHPDKFVDANNWKDVSVGETDGAIKDGDFVRVPFTIRHAKAIKSIKDGKSQISMGYSASLEWTQGVTDSGEKYDFIMRDLRMNHLAIVDAARGGPDLRIGDGQVSTKKEALTMKIVYDGLTVDLADESAANAFAKKLTDKAEAAIKRADDAEKALIDANAAHATALADNQKAHDKALGEKDAKIADLEGKIVDQAAIDKLADAKADTVAAARKALGDKAPDFAGKSVADVRRATVAAKFGDAAVADKSDDYVEARFDALVSTNDSGFDPYRSAMAARESANLGDARAEAEKAYLEFASGANYGK